MHDPRLTGVPDPLLSPLLERLAMLETAKDGLEYQLSDRNFTSEMQNSMLRERLDHAQAEIARQQEALDNFCSEILAALQARDAAQAAAEESLKIHTGSLAELDALKLQQEIWLQAKVDFNDLSAQRRAERDQTRGELEESRKSLAATLAERDQTRSELEESRKSRAATLAELDALKHQQEIWLREKADLSDQAAKRLAERDQARGELDALRPQADEGRRVGWKLESDIAALRAERDALAAKIELNLRGGEKLTSDLAAAEAKLEGERLSSQEQLRALRDSLNNPQALPASPAPAPAAAPAPPPPVEVKLDPVWEKVLPALRRPVAAAFARLRQLPLGAIPEGPRAMIRLAAASLTQTSDMLKALEEYLEENGPPAAAGRADVPIEAALAAWEGPFRLRRIKIVRRVETGLPQVLVREESLRVAVFQVLRNVYDALPAGGTLTVQLARDAASGGMTVRFTDNGRGFSPSALLTLFAPFAGARPGHLGLGLSLARAILRRCGGDVEAANGPVKGAVVTLRLVPSDAPSAIA